MKKKTLLTAIGTVVFIAAMVLPMILVSPVAADLPDPEDWYRTVGGVLEDDYYSLYPYEEKSLKIGVSKFGELIDSREDVNVGLEYSGERDAFAPPVGSGIDDPPLPKKTWICGWLINITYVHTTHGKRNVWASALHADLTSYGRNWIRVDNNYGSCPTEADEDPKDPGYEFDENMVPQGPLVYGGRKTNGTVYTEPLKILYHGPRRFVAVSHHMITDWFEDAEEEIPLVNVTLTFIFNKVKKEIVILKNIKLIVPKFVIGYVDIDVPEEETISVAGLIVQFSNRAEWDLGKPKDYKSYVHFYTQGQSSDRTCGGTDDSDHAPEGLLTKYGPRYELIPTLPACYSIYGTAQAAHGSEPYDRGSGWSTFDVAQIISDDLDYVGWMAFWPSCSDWSADAGKLGQWWKSFVANEAHAIDAKAATEPYRSPLVVGEWDFLLTEEPFVSDPVYGDIGFRGVTVYGITDAHSDGDVDWLWSPNGVSVGAADDADIDYGHDNVIDREVAYQLNEVFNPWDLQTAVTKKPCRWVQYDTRSGARDILYEHSEAVSVGTPSAGEPAIDYVMPPYWSTVKNYVYTWHAYCTFAERVEVLATGEVLERGVDYTLIYDGYDPIGIHIGRSDVDDVKILYSTEICWHDGAEALGIEEGYWSEGRYEWLIVGRDSASVDSAGAAMVSEFFDSVKNMTVWISALDMQDDVWGPKVPFIMSWMRDDVGDEDDLIEVRPGVYQYSRAHYRDDEFGPCHGKSALKDDWCTIVPISSSNIITIGSSWANHATEYFNEFIDAYLDVGTGESMYPGDIVALTCWNKNTYAPEWSGDEQTKGYAVIATYKDLNGTVGFVIFGWTGQDTWYACYAFFNDGLGKKLQEEPLGITALIIELDYTGTCPYTWKVVEALGTISEYNFEGTEWKGIQPPIHDC